ncbi:RNA polymerase factor sigma-54 [Thermodesulforhabdus norvegica]|uniref:RNA polymerase, sigma 54 subunit, RpoN/SigL n=1 Tax=Thermodesulforhabdus norvegica TaxID=39841 RepID=A0A1I4VJ93_9BACT|nr:RNA polymerase factor sigma-54 [Thermodesulforhabdus norvegica]SFN01219.1 RNA polymerase, sigma 54 subunit, RpoN/SigL [Thermodesulforhabdus norvegica]
MALELKQQLKVTTQLVITPQLQQAIKLLQLSRMELLETIQQEMMENPVLEEVPVEEDITDGSESGAEEPAPELSERTSEVEVSENLREDFDWESFLEEYNSGTPVLYEKEEGDELPSFEQRLSRPTSLTDHLMWQLHLSDFSEEEVKIGEAIIGNIDSHGYLDATVEEIATLCDTSVDKVERVLYRIQDFDPPGVAARDLRECLLIQARNLFPDNELVISIIKDHIHYLENKNYQGLIKKLGISSEEFKDALELILSLDPRPGRAYASLEPQFISPDVYVVKVDNDFVVMLNEEGLPRLRISPYYREFLKHPERMTPEVREYIQKKLSSASWLIKSIHQRQRTLLRVAESIVKLQREFFEKGVEYLKPMVLRDIAVEVGMHESTISRVTTNKYMQTPHGIFELKYFFNSSIRKTGGDEIASESVKEKIRAIIKNENPQKPFSDQEIAKILKQEGIRIARRTVAKYREMLGILPSHKRKKPVF